MISVLVHLVVRVVMDCDICDRSACIGQRSYRARALRAYAPSTIESTTFPLAEGIASRCTD